MTSPRCSTLEHSTVISRSVCSPLASTVSTATIAPPARVIAAVTLPSTPPGFCGSSTRRVSENCAEGVGHGRLAMIRAAGLRVWRTHDALAASPSPCWPPDWSPRRSRRGVSPGARGPGADGIGDRLFPQLGNGGYDAKHYDLAVTYASSAPEQDVAGKVTMSARATQSLSRFDLDFAGDSVESRAGRRARAPASTRAGAGARDHARARDQAGQRSSRSSCASSPGPSRRRPTTTLPFGWFTTVDGSVTAGQPDQSQHDLPGQRPPGRQGELHDQASTCPTGVDGGRQRRAAVALDALAGAPRSVYEMKRADGVRADPARRRQARRDPARLRRRRAGARRGADGARAPARAAPSRAPPTTCAG